MERNWDMIRDILIKLEELDPAEGALKLSTFPTDKAYEYSYHVELLIEAGLIYGEMSKTVSKNAHDFSVNRLTWSGHEFLDSIRSDNVWNKTKKSFLSSGVTMTLDLVRSVATDIATAFLKQTISS